MSDKTSKPVVNGWAYQILCAMHQAILLLGGLSRTTADQIAKVLSLQGCQRSETFIKGALDRLVECGLAFKKHEDQWDFYWLATSGTDLVGELLKEPLLWTDTFRGPLHQQSVILAYLTTHPGWHDLKELAQGTGMSTTTIRQCIKEHLGAKVETQQAPSAKGIPQNEYRLLGVIQTSPPPDEPVVQEDVHVATAEAIVASVMPEVEAEAAKVPDYKALRQKAVSIGFQLAYGGSPIPVPDGEPVPFPKDNLEDGWVDEIIAQQEPEKAPEPEAEMDEEEMDEEPRCLLTEADVGEEPEVEKDTVVVADNTVVVVPMHIELHQYLTAMAVMRRVSVEELVVDILGLTVDQVRAKVAELTIPIPF
jgi:hypothetical protein